MLITTTRRRAARDLCRTLAVVAAFMFAVATWTTIVGGSHPAAAAAVPAGLEAVTPSSGNSDTDFTIQLPDGASCPGDSVGGGYVVRSYMVPSTVSPSGLTFDALGPVNVGGEFRTPLISSNGDALVTGQTNLAATPGGPGLITGLPIFDFQFFAPGEVPAGTYNIGVACTLGNGADQLTNYWNGQMVVTEDAVGGGPAQFTFTTSLTPPTTSPATTSPDTTSPDTTSPDTTSPDTTSPDTTSPATTGTTTSTSTPGSGSVSGAGFGGGGPSAASPVTSMGQLPYTGGSPVPMLVWGALLLVFGRMAILLGRKPKVRPAS